MYPVSVMYTRLSLFCSIRKPQEVIESWDVGITFIKILSSIVSSYKYSLFSYGSFNTVFSTSLVM